MRADPKPEKRIKTHKCKVCKKDFVKTNPLFTWCSNDCAYELSKQILTKERQKKATAERNRIRQEKDKLKTKSDYIKDLQKCLNQVIRLIDKDELCITRNTFDSGIANTFDAGHYYSTGSVPALKFWAHNIHKQSKRSNRDLGGEPLLFQENLIIRYGQDYVDNLRYARQLFIKMNWSIDQLKYAISEIKVIDRAIRSGLTITRDEINERLQLYDVKSYYLVIQGKSKE